MVTLRHWIFCTVGALLLTACPLPEEEGSEAGAEDAGAMTGQMDAGMDSALEGDAEAGLDIRQCVSADASLTALLLGCTSRECDAIGACCLAAGQCCSDLSVPVSGFPECAADTRTCFESKVAVSETALPGLTQETLGWIPGTSLDQTSALRWHNPLLTGSVLRVAVKLVVPEVAFCDSECRQRVGFGIVPHEAQDWQPVVSVQVSAQRKQAVLLVRGLSVASAAITASAHEMSLELSPSGNVDWRIDGVHQASVQVPFAGSVNLVIQGSNYPAGAPQARIERVAATTRTCDTPSAWTGRAPLLSSQSDFPLSHPTQVITAEGQWLAAQRSDGVALAFVTPPAKVDPSLFAEATLKPMPGTFYADAISHPELTWENDRPVLYFGAAAQGVYAIGRAEYEPKPRRWSRVEQVVSAAALGVDEVGEPTLLTYRGERLMAVRAKQGAETMLLLLTQEAASPVDGGMADASDVDSSVPVLEYVLRGGQIELARIPVPSGVEASDPELSTTSETMLLYYTARGLDRSRIAAVASPDGKTWIDIREQLAPRDTLDRLGVESCDLAIVDDEVRMLYVGSDGSFTHLLSTVRPQHQR